MENQITVELLYEDALRGREISQSKKKMLKEYLSENYGYTNEDWRNLMEIRESCNVYCISPNQIYNYALMHEISYQSLAKSERMMEYIIKV